MQGIEPEVPYPEVVSYTENGDGTVTLTINAVYPNENTSKAYSHKTIIRPLEDGGFQYVSNQMILSEDGYETWWHSDRLTDEEREKLFSQENSAEESGTEAENDLWYLPHAEDCLLTDTEKDVLKDTALTGAGQVKEVCKDIEIIGVTSYGSDIEAFTKEQCREVVSLLGKAGIVLNNTFLRNSLEFLRFGIFHTKRIDGNRLDHLIFQRSVGIIGSCFSDAVHRLHTFNHFPKRRISAV